MSLRGIRGAITVERDEPELVLAATERLLRAIVAENDVDSEEIASALFSLTGDLCSEFPAVAARRMGWTRVPLLNFTEVPVTGSLPHCIRVLLHVNTNKQQAEMVHVYLDGARVLRPDLERA